MLKAAGGILLSALAMFSLTARVAAGQSGPRDTKHELALQLIAKTKAVAMAISTVEAAIPAQRAATPQLPPEFWDLFLAKAKASADSLSHLMAPAYAEAFSEEEIRGLLAFYDTPLGRRLVDTQPQVIARTTEIGQRWGAALGMSVARELEDRRRQPD